MFDPSFVPRVAESGTDISGGAGESNSKTAEPIPLSGLLKPRPWVLVRQGSFNGYFDWVPREYRTGSWSPWAFASLLFIALGLAAGRPREIDFCTTSYPPAYSGYWYYNVAAAAWMAFVLGWNVMEEGLAVPFSTFTVWSWTMLLLRHALSAMAPFLGGHESSLLVVAESLRCPSLLNASVVFVVWNLILAPGIYVTMDTDEKKAMFRRWLVQFNLLNQHGLNLPLAVVGCVLSSPRRFTAVDLWCGVATVSSYLAFYLLVLDRLGVHLYPVFSPRSKWCAAVWMAVVLGYCGLFRLVQGWILTIAPEC